jgi:nitrogen fixation/metabolism regulation signal transduction histidine kinase
MTDLNSIANILKVQEDVKNKLLKIDSYQSDRRRSRTSYEAIGKPESIQNFGKACIEIKLQIDSAYNQISMITHLNSTIFNNELYHGPYTENGRKMLELIADVDKNSKTYEETFNKWIEDSTIQSSVKKKNAAIAPISSVSSLMDITDQKFTQSLKEINKLIDDQTKIVIKEIENRINEVKRQTIVILSGIVILAIGFALVFSNTITNSMRRLKESAGVIGKGDFDFDASGYPNDEIGDLAAAFFDMATDLKTAQDELVKSRRLAAIGEVVASVNHEINNPLMIISGNAQFLEMSMKDYPEETKERIQTILEETERISRVTKKLREIKNPVVEDYTASGEQMINLDKSIFENGLNES